MAEAQKSEDIGMKRGRAIAQLTPTRQLDIIAQGLPILLKSADELMTAAEALDDHPRAAAILIGQATEELSKVLILMDIVRCPPKARGGLIGQMFKWFYEHLPRLLYAEAQHWRPTTVAQLQEYLDNSRRSHDVDGFAGEFIMPNSTLFARENRLYADIVTHEDGELIWSEPSDWMPARFAGGRISIWYVAKALSDVGAFSRAGLDIVSQVWSAVDFAGETECYSVPRNLTQRMLERLRARFKSSSGVAIPCGSADEH
ncbi:hypothetical protein, partial [Novosphingobium sp. TCA1]|uniref:hypothetical protein n=1 Tax=Novosphingobium sp. TCA1 TaxID=2682474 RepID=UPI00135C252F